MKIQTIENVQKAKNNYGFKFESLVLHESRNICEKTRAIGSKFQQFVGPKIKIPNTDAIQKIKNGYGLKYQCLIPCLQ